TAGCDWLSRSHSAETCNSPSWARANRILRRDRSERDLKISVRPSMVLSDTVMLDVTLAGPLLARGLGVPTDVGFKANPSSENPHGLGDASEPKAVLLRVR